MVKLYENLSSKHAKIFCSIQSLKTRSTQLEGIMLNQGLPAELSFQQKYYDSLANPEVKESFVKNLIENKKSLLEKRIADLQAIYDARPAELKNKLSPFEKTNSGSNLFDNVAFDWLKVLDSFIQIQICKMIAKSTEDAAKKEAKRNKFIAKKEELAKPKVLTTHSSRLSLLKPAHSKPY
jgi:hypothetical protein